MILSFASVVLVRIGRTASYLFRTDDRLICGEALPSVIDFYGGGSIKCCDSYRRTLHH